MSTFEERQARVNEIQAAIQTGSISDSSSSKLAEYIAWLSEPTIQGHFNGQNYPQACETVRLHMLRAMIEGFEQRGKAMQWWVVALAVAALVTSVVQTAVAIRAEIRAAVEFAPPSQPPQSHASPSSASFPGVASQPASAPKPAAPK